MRCSIILPACLAAPLLLGCGSRSQIEALGLAAPTEDPCPSAVSGPKAMRFNCSTRDGRSRVAAPSAPHVAWTTKLPVGSPGYLGPGEIATDASGHAYVVAGAAGESVAGLRRVDVADGSIDWTVPISLSGDTSIPVVLAHGGVDMFASGAGTANALFTFDPASGASTSTTFGLDLSDAAPDPAVGADGSLYVAHTGGVGTAYVSRVAPDGTVLWTSVDLGTLAPPTEPDDGKLFPSNIALGKGDLALVALNVTTKSGKNVASVIALDPATGAVRWSQALDGQGSSPGPVVRADGAVVYSLLEEEDASQLVVLDPESGAPTFAPLPMPAWTISAVTTDGSVIGVDVDKGITAIGRDGTVLWENNWNDSHTLTIASDGTVITSEPFAAIDPATGETKWQLRLANPQCIADVALTSEGGIVVLGCDGTLYGVSD